MGQSPFPAELATLATHEHKEIEEKAQGRQVEIPSTCQSLLLAHFPPLLVCAILQDEV